jgi:hypothetical protein
MAVSHRCWKELRESSHETRECAFHFGLDRDMDLKPPASSLLFIAHLISLCPASPLLLDSDPTDNVIHQLCHLPHLTPDTILLIGNHR